MAMAILEKQTTTKHFLSSLHRKLTVIEAKNENLKKFRAHTMTLFSSLPLKS
jgi:hypothetical protein